MVVVFVSPCEKEKALLRKHCLSLDESLCLPGWASMSRHLFILHICVEPSALGSDASPGEMEQMSQSCWESTERDRRMNSQIIIQHEQGATTGTDKML